MKQFLKRALQDTFSDKIESLVLVLMGSIISLIGLLALEDKTVALGEVPFVAAGLIGSFGALFLLFLWNLVCAPYRIERDGHTAVREGLTSLQNELSGLKPNESLVTFFSKREKFTLKEAAHLLADSPITRGETVGVAAGYLSDLETAAYKGALKPLRPINPMDMTTYKMSRNVHINWKRPPQEDLEISKVELERYVSKEGLPSLSRLLPIASELI